MIENLRPYLTLRRILLYLVGITGAITAVLLIAFGIGNAFIVFMLGAATLLIAFGTPSPPRT